MDSEFNSWCSSALTSFAQKGLLLNEDLINKVSIVQTIQRLCKSASVLPVSLQQTIKNTPLVEFLHWICSDFGDFSPIGFKNESGSYSTSTLYTIALLSFNAPAKVIEDFLVQETQNCEFLTAFLINALDCLDLWSDYFHVIKTPSIKNKCKWICSLLEKIIKKSLISTNLLSSILSQTVHLGTRALADLAEFQELKATLSSMFEQKSKEHYQGINDIIKNSTKLINNQLEANLSEEDDFDVSSMPDIVATMTKVHLQIDNVGDRLLMRHEQETLFSNEIFAGNVEGTLVINPEHLCWFVQGEKRQGIKVACSTLHHIHISVFNLDNRRIHKKNGTKPNQIMPIYEESENLMSISLYFREKTFRLYPFTMEEVDILTDRLWYVTRLRPMSSSVLIRTILMEKIDAVRQVVLKQLLETDKLMIETPKQLDKVVGDLTAEHKPQRMEDMERLYQSCKLEREVAKEALLYLKKYWYNTQAESVKLKVLSVLDRLIDPVVMRFGDQSFDSALKWLIHLDETLNPYKSPEALQMVNLILVKAKAIQMDLLTPIVNNQVASIFDDWEAYTFMMEEMTIHQNRLK